MSSILEALKKAESESPPRERVEMRAGRLALNAAPRPERRRRFKWLLLAGGVMAAVGVAVWFLKPVRTVTSSAHIQSYRITPPGSAAPREATGQALHRTPVQTPAASRRGSPPPKRTADRKPVPGPSESAPAPQRKAAPSAVKAANPSGREAVKPSATRTAARKTATKKSAVPPTPVYQHSGHGLTLQAIAWDPDARKRFAVVNNQIVREGQSVERKVVERIAEDEIIVAQGGKRWKIEFRIE